MSAPSVNRWTGECFSNFGRTNHRLHPNSLYLARETSSPVQVSTELTLRVIFHPGSWTFVASCSTEQLSSGELTSDALSDFSCCPRQKHLSFLFVVMQLNLTVVKSASWSAHTCVSLSLSVSLRYSLFKCPSRTLRIIKTNWEQNTTSSQFQWSLQGSVFPPHVDVMVTIRSDSESAVRFIPEVLDRAEVRTCRALPHQTDNHFVTEIIYNCALKCFCHDPTNIVNKSIQRWFMCVWVQSTYFWPYWIKNTTAVRNKREQKRSEIKTKL